MNKKIVIKSCEDCPHKDHRGAFGTVRYIPVCRMGDQTLPYTVGNNPHMSGSIAYYTGVIPDHCPLEDNNG